MSSKRRTVLQRGVIAMGVIAVVTFAFVLLKGTLGFNPSTGISQGANNIAEDVAPGETAMRRNQDKLIWYSHLNTTQLESLNNYPDSLVKHDSGCAVDVKYCVLNAETGQTGIQLRFVESVPPQLPAELPWSGGFVNPIDGAVYDLLGRAYRFQGEVARLTVIETQSLTKPD